MAASERQQRPAMDEEDEEEGCSSPNDSRSAVPLMQEPECQKPYAAKTLLAAWDSRTPYKGISHGPAAGLTSPSSGAEVRKTTADRGGRLAHLIGTRCFLSIWILGDHFVHGASLFGNRANVAVDCFVIMSGFVTHWAYGSCDLDSRQAIVAFYVRRIGRVLLPTYISMVAATALMAAITEPPDALHVLRCVCFLEPWLQPQNWCPNGQSWTIAAMLPSWLLYPGWKLLVASVEAHWAGRGLVSMLLALWASCFCPSLLIFVAQGGWITNEQHSYTYIWPPSQLADFAMGVVAAALARRHTACGLNDKRRACLADSSVALIVGVILMVPYSGYHVGWEPLFNHGLAPLLAMFLYGSAAAGGAGGAAQVLSLPPLTWLGKYSFEIFLFQQPLFSAFEHIWLVYLQQHVPKWVIAVLFMLTLFTVSGLYAELVEVPYLRLLKAFTARPDETRYY